MQGGRINQELGVNIHTAIYKIDNQQGPMYSTVSLRKLRELVMDREAWHAAVHGEQRVRHN